MKSIIHSFRISIVDLNAYNSSVNNCQSLPTLLSGCTTTYRLHIYLFRGTQRLFSANICSKKQMLPRNFDSSRKAKYF